MHILITIEKNGVQIKEAIVSENKAAMMAAHILGKKHENVDQGKSEALALMNNVLSGKAQTLVNDMKIAMSFHVIKVKGASVLTGKGDFIHRIEREIDQNNITTHEDLKNLALLAGVALIGHNFKALTLRLSMQILVNKRQAI